MNVLKAIKKALTMTSNVRFFVIVFQRFVFVNKIQY